MKNYTQLSCRLSHNELTHAFRIESFIVMMDIDRSRILCYHMLPLSGESFQQKSIGGFESF